MAHAIDVAKYILTKTGEMTAMKLQKLVYYSQAPLAKDPEDLAHILCLLLEVFESPEGHLKLAGSDLAGILCLISCESSVVEDISNDV